MQVEILNATTYPLTTIGTNASYCYNTQLRDINHARKIAEHCIKSGHGRNLEFADITLKITCSARCAREFYTHIGGAPTRVQASTRYITYDNFKYFIPKFPVPELEQDYNEVMDIIREFYNKMKQYGTENDVTGYILPLAMETTFIWKGNVRTLENMFNQRLCLRALDEYRQLMLMIKAVIYDELDNEWEWINNNLFISKCAKAGYCPENNKKCVLYKER
jgi:thymidylate synthase (FAD)